MNADDFGLTAGVNRAIVELHRAGVLTSTTLMANAEATKEAIQLALATPTLGVGCHVVLVDGEPVLDPEQVPSLIDKATGRFYPTLGKLLPRLYAGQIRAAHIEAEATAQIAKLKTHGLTLTHIDTHKHTHMFPPVLKAVLCAAKAAGIRAVRNPFEPAWSTRAAHGAGFVRSAQVLVLRRFAPAFRRITAAQGFATSDGAVAVAATGALNAAAVQSLVATLPAGNWELVTHPGYNDADLARVRTRLRESREIEREALLALKGAKGVELISFASLP